MQKKEERSDDKIYKKTVRNSQINIVERRKKIALKEKQEERKLTTTSTVFEGNSRK